MRVKVNRTAYLDGSIRKVGDEFEWSYTGDKIPDWMERVPEVKQEPSKQKPKANG